MKDKMVAAKADFRELLKVSFSVIIKEITFWPENHNFWQFLALKPNFWTNFDTNKANNCP